MADDEATYAQMLAGNIRRYNERASRPLMLVNEKTGHLRFEREFTAITPDAHMGFETMSPDMDVKSAYFWLVGFKRGQRDK